MKYFTESLEKTAAIVDDMIEEGPENIRNSDIAQKLMESLREIEARKPLGAGKNPMVTTSIFR